MEVDSTDAVVGENAEPVTTLIRDMTTLLYRNPVWLNAEHTSMRLEACWFGETEWWSYDTASFDPEPAGSAFFARVVAETGEENIVAFVPPPPPPIQYTIAKTLPWERMTDDEADSFDAWLSSTTTRYRNLHNAATELAYNQAAVSTLWAPYYASLKNLLGRTRAQEIMASTDNLLHPFDPV